MLLVDGRRVALVPAGHAAAELPAGAGGLQTTRLELPLRAVVDHPHRVELHDGTFPGPDRLEGGRLGPRRGHRGAQRRADRRPHRRPAPLPAGPAVEPARPPRRELLGRARRRHADRAEGETAERPRRARRRTASPACSRTPPPARACCCCSCWRRFGWGALHALSPGHGKAMVAAYLVGTRGSAAARDRARRDGHGDPHDRRVRARRGHARAVAVRAAGGPLSLADADLRAAGRGRRSGRAALAGAQGAAATRTRTTTSTHDHATTTTTT